jgi:hypothetical protein
MDSLVDISICHIMPSILPLLAPHSRISNHYNLLHRLEIIVIDKLLDHYTFPNKLSQRSVGIRKIS